MYKKPADFIYINTDHDYYVRQISFTFAVFSAIVSVLLFGLWSNVYVFAQHSSAASPRSASYQQSSSGSSSTKMSPGWTTLASAASNQQQIANNNNNNNTKVVSGTTGSKVANTAPIVNPIDRSLSTAATTASPRPLSIGPQLNAISQQQQQQHSQALSNNGTGIRDYTLTSNSPVAAPDKLLYLGYHDASTNSNNLAARKTSTSTSEIDPSSSSKDKPDSHHSNGTTRESSIGDSKSPTHHSSSSTSHNSSIGKTTTSTSKTSSKDIKPCTHNNSFPRETSEPRDHTHHGCNENNKVKNKNSPKGHNDHNGNGDRFFGSDSFFNGDTFFSTVGKDI